MREKGIPFCTKGLMTALCSFDDTITWSEEVKRPLIIQFKASVTFRVKAMDSG